MIEVRWAMIKALEVGLVDWENVGVARGNRGGGLVVRRIVDRL